MIILTITNTINNKKPKIPPPPIGQLKCVTHIARATVSAHPPNSPVRNQQNSFPRLILSSHNRQRAS